MDTPDIEVLFQQRTPATEVAEAARFRTLKTGPYLLTPEQAEFQLAGEKSPWPGRQIVHIRVQATEGGESRGRMFFDASPESRRDAKGELDRPAKLWRQLISVYQMGDKSDGDVYTTLTTQKWPFNGYVTEAFRKPEGGWVSARTEADRKEYLEAGYEPSNFVQTISKVKNTA